MTPRDFDYLRTLLKSASGLVLTDDKQYLIESRLLPVAKKLKYETIDAMVAELRRSEATSLKNQIVEAMTINESFFFRDKTPFDNFENIMLPKLLEAKKSQKHLRIWSAAASTGQEAYSLSMILQEYAAELEGWRIEIIGTDLCSEALEKAKAGLYSQFEVQRGMPVKYLVKNFKQVGSMWQVNSKIRSSVQYRQFNLLNSFNLLGRFDIIFCRNVLIYFDKETKSDIIARMGKQTNPNCYLVLGASETLVGLNDSFGSVPDARGLYQIKNQAGSKPASAITRPASGTPLAKTGTTGRNFTR
ncbi:protein-glutamate O-methyltransferase CheR [Hyphomicrobiales bacterium 4NK60-0047b]|jgi:chemotaxis protein methyltransferase CheR